MFRSLRPLLGAIAAAAAVHASAACLSPGADLNTAIAGATAGSTICLAPGTYSVPSGLNFSKAVTLIGNAPTPASVILQGPGSGTLVNFSASGATLQNLTLQGATQAININGLTDITLKDLVATTPAGAVNHGIVVQNAARIDIDNVTITPQFSGFLLINVTSSVVMNSTVPKVQNAGGVGIALFGGSNNVIVNNTFGSPKSGTTYSLPTGGVVFYNSSGNRFENNVVQGFDDDGVDFTANDVTNGAGVATAPAADNYIAKNTVIATGFADGHSAGSGIWSNCGGDNNWIYGNDAHGVPEQGVVVFMARSNMVLGNTLHDNKLGGLFVSGGSETPPFCPAASATFQNVQPVDTFLKSNSIFFNRDENVVIRDAATTEFASNIVSAHNGLGGPTRDNEFANGLGQSMVFFESDSRVGFASTGISVLANASHDNVRAFQSDDAASSGVTFAFNRLLQSSPNRFNRYQVSTSQVFDAGANVGGNYWTLHPVTGNPSTGTQVYGTSGAGNPLLGVYDNATTSSPGLNHTGRVVDRFPYQSEDLGRPGAIKVFEPLGGEFVAQGTRRTVRWYAPGCMYVDLALDDGTALSTSAANTGYAVVTIPVTAPIGSHTVSVTCKTSTGAMVSAGTSLSFTITPSTLQLLAPGRDDVLNTGSSVIVAWKGSSVASVDIDLSTNGGSTWTSLATNQPGTVARVTLPAGASSAYGMIRVKDHLNPTTVLDSTDGVFAVRGTSGFGFTNITGGRPFVMGQTERLEWASPQGSRLVTITASSPIGATVVTKLPDRGFYDWVMPDLGVGTLTLTISFMQSNGTPISSAAPNSNGVTRDPQTITFNSVASVGTGNTTTVTATTNSGLLPVLSSTTTGTCTISGGTVTGVAPGTCTIAANQAGNTTFAQAMTSTLTFPVVDTSNPPRLFNISTRMQVLTGNNVMIAGFVIGGTTPKTVAIIATGPSLAPFGITNPLMNPTLQLVRQSDHATLATNDDWQTDPNAGQLSGQTFAPTDPRESAIVTTLPPGAYTAIVSGVGGSTGVSVVAVYEMDHPEVPLINISTRGFVQGGNNVMIAGLIVQGTGPQKVLITGIGPSLAPFGITNPLMNPTLQLVRSSDSAVIATNDDWQSSPDAAAISATGVAPTDPRESAILITLDPGAYTAILSGVGGGTGVGVVGVFTE